MASDTLATYIRGLQDAFAVSDKYAAHQRAQSVLQDLGASRAAFTEILERHLARHDAFTLRHYPVVSLEIETNAHFGLVANCWIPLPDRDTDMSTKAIHHHGTMLLTTVTAFGPGYEHWMFTTPAPIDESRELYSMRLIERAPHPEGHAAFVDANIGHVPFYPASLTITLALWSSREATSWKDRLKRVPALHKHSQTLRAVAMKAGLTKALDLKHVRYFDFYPTDEGFRGMKDRIEFGRGPTEDYLQSLFHLLQGTGNAALSRTVRARLSEDLPHASLVSRLVEDLERGRPIDGRLSEGHYGVPFANFRAAPVERALALAAKTTLAPADAGAHD